MAGMTGTTADGHKTRCYKKRERTRNQLLAAAIDVIAQRGEAFSVSDITKHAGASNGTFYNYFHDREELIDAVATELIRGFADESAVLVDHTDPALRFATITALALARASTDPVRIRVVLRLDAVQRAIIDGGVVNHLRADLATGAATGRFNPNFDEATLDVIVGAIVMAARRITDDDVDNDYPARIISHLLRTLGVADDEASELAGTAVSAASNLATI